MHFLGGYYSSILWISWLAWWGRCHGDSLDKVTTGEDWNQSGSCSNAAADDTCASPNNNDNNNNSHQKDACQDTLADCSIWASQGECEINANYMKMHCAASCGNCDENGNFLQHYQWHDDEAEWSDWDKDETSRRMGKVQILDPGNLNVSRTQIQQVIDQALVYLDSKALGTQLEACQNQHELCAVWAALGECNVNPSYMQRNCSPVCQSCNLLTIEGRCPLDPNAPNAWDVGDLNRMFERLTSEPYLSKYQVQIWSSPSLNDGPWIITMENVISSEEAHRLIELGHVEGYKQSMSLGGIEPDGTLTSISSNYRTSFNAWCQNECYQDEVALDVIYRLSNLTGIAEANSEYLQLLRYESGQYYKSHIDYVDNETERQQGPRILTVFLYLNDVEEGGETEFTLLDLKVTPKLGRAVLWPNVLNDSPHEPDTRTKHQALPVKAGMKYGANAWFHQRDFKEPYRTRCLG